MLFGQSLFQSVLERLQAEAIDEDEDSATKAYRVRGLGASFIAEPVNPAAADLERGQALYREMMEDMPPTEPEVPPAPPEPPAHLLRLTPEEIAADLDLRTTDSVAVLAEKRRAFARLNHPDGVVADFREMATVRMKIANLLVDEAIRLQTV
ncbi:hypothetical protein [Rhizobium sp. RU36D]|uniref:hypothetical protein n=1 Tax=Rhizobium sp. RU36D TaxID=1907415 RepID=UPI0009D8C271|nr:hypothetical protein [Rhizobium sp. RU36D]SMD02797.1 hypothetical protein SAMN05880593_11644 [Rhizobium sp. RU36D]